MGQAKRRGNREQRIRQAIVRENEIIELARKERLEKAAEQKRKAQEWWGSLTPEQQAEHKLNYALKKRRQAGVIPFVLIAAAVAAGMS